MDSEPVWLPIARSYLGTREIHGPQHNARIVQWFSDIRTTFRDDETAWCAAFVGGVLEKAGIKSTRSAAARSYLNWGMAINPPVLGAIAVYSRPGSTWGGHVGFVVGRDQRGNILTLGGNQGDEVNVRPFDPSRVLGYRYPLTHLSALHYQTLPVVYDAGALSTRET